ncbi:carboxylesterase family protein [Agromyces luteolus]|uniref:Carboxylic ester hydrolase n=2 Tax=Agromyces luteolus TaxID=88373 RepID=A0A7C9HS21_9MICO|nr:carboxylesterase family protein [Agromyces luteolus]MUN05645.1 carboxylesterase family protein [Agromyces luteolus]
MTRAGAVRGRWRGEPGAPGASAAFLGIPFAEPPVGELRFAPPEPARPWEGVRDALEHGPTPQRGDPGATIIPEPSVPGEATLNVDVFTPAPGPAGAGAGAEGLPVLVWFHGGGYVAGSPASPWYDGRTFNRDGVVTVNVSYRLGFDGFGWIEGAPANRGVLDWLLALEWVRDNVAAFGGDPGRVTVAGQSAGGGAVLTLLGMPRARGLFHRVWAASPAVADVSRDRAKALARRIGELGGIRPDLDGLRSLSEERVRQLQREALRAARGTRGGGAQLVADGLPIGPVVDGDLLPATTTSSLASGVGASVPLVLGTTDDEFSAAFRAAAGRLRWVPRKSALKRLGLAEPRRSAWLEANRGEGLHGTAAVLGRYVSDHVFRAPLVRTVAARELGATVAATDGAAPAATWAYRFSWRSPVSGAAVHCLDVPFLFDVLPEGHVPAVAGVRPPQGLADRLHADVVAFVRGADPAWPTAAGEAFPARLYGSTIATMPDAYASARPLAGV